MEPLPDLATLSDDELKELIDELDAGGAGGLVPPPDPARQDRHPARRARRAAAEDAAGKSVLDQVDVDALTEILAGRPRRRRDDEPRLLPRVRLPEPGGRELLRALRRAARPARRRRRRRMTFTPEEPTRTRARTLADLGIEGPALVVRSGGGRAGETSASRASARRSAARPTATSSSTTSPSRASTRVVTATAASSRIEDLRQPQRHLRQPQADRVAPRSRTATRCRSASTG